MDLFFEIVQVALGVRSNLSRKPSESEWIKILEISKTQAITGLTFFSVEKLSREGLKPPTSILYNWIGISEQIRLQNLFVNRNVVSLFGILISKGFECCLLKGQGNALAYPNLLSRIPGDIDVWVMPKSDGRCKTEDIKRVIRFARGKNPKAKACYHHVDYGEFNGIEVELHYRPSFMFNPIHNGRLQKWYSKMADGGWLIADLPENAGSIKIPNREFNIIFQLSHIYNHLLHEGIGLKQVIDYFYLLKSAGRVQMDDVSNTLRHLGLEKIAGAMMWVLGYLVYGEGYMVHSSKRDDWMICEPEEKRGKVLLAEIMKGGNFGHYDAENQKANSAVKKNIQRVKRDIRMMRYFPSECLWEPFFRLYHWGWRLVH